MEREGYPELQRLTDKIHLRSASLTFAPHDNIQVAENGMLRNHQLAEAQRDQDIIDTCDAENRIKKLYEQPGVKSDVEIQQSVERDRLLRSPHQSPFQGSNTAKTPIRSPPPPTKLAFSPNINVGNSAKKTGLLASPVEKFKNRKPSAAAKRSRPSDSVTKLGRRNRDAEVKKCRARWVPPQDPSSVLEQVPPRFSGQMPEQAPAQAHSVAPQQTFRPSVLEQVPPQFSGQMP